MNKIILQIEDEIALGSKNHIPEETAESVVESEENVETLNQALTSSKDLITILQNKLKKTELNTDYFRTSNEHTLYYTGLPTYQYLNILFEIVAPYVSKQSSLSPFQQLVLTLMKLRLNLQFTDLGYRFSIHRTTAARAFYRTIDILYNRLQV